MYTVQKNDLTGKESVYDTESATKIASVWDGEYGDDDYYSETLYELPKTNFFFLHIQGGKNRLERPKWVKDFKGETKKDLLKAEAMEWLYDNGFTELYHKVKTGKERKSVLLNLSLEAKAVLDKEKTRRMGISNSDIVETLLLGLCDDVEVCEETDEYKDFVAQMLRTLGDLKKTKKGRIPGLPRYIYIKNQRIRNHYYNFEVDLVKMKVQRVK